MRFVFLGMFAIACILSPFIAVAVMAVNDPQSISSSLDDIEETIR